MAFLLAEAPGFADVADSLITGGTSYATGFLWSAIKDDIAAGTVMPEFFQGFYRNGQQVPLAVSPTDQYTYARNELMYLWELVNTTNMGNGLPSANGGYYFGQYNVDQATGNVSCTTAYYIPGGAQTNTNDGVLKVTTIGIRGKQLRKIIATIAGSVTSGTFQVGEMIVQASTGASAFLDPTSAVPGSGTTMTILAAVMGVPDASRVWIGQESGATYTPTALPTPFAFKYNIAGSIASGVFLNGEIIKQASTNAQAILTLYPTGTTLNILGPITVGTADSSHTWTGQTSGATFTPSGAPVYISSRYTDLAAAAFDSDAAARQTLMRDLMNNARLSTVRTECFLMNPSGAPTWQPNLSVTVGQLIQPSGRWANGCWYVCAQTGTTGTVEPGPWPSELTENGPVEDGSTLWNIAGAGFTFGQQVPLPVSFIDGYQYAQAEIYAVIPFFITTLAIPVQRGVDIIWNGGTGDVRALSKNISSTAPTSPSYLPQGTSPPDVTGATLYTQWNPSNPNAVNYTVAGADTGTFVVGETVTQAVTGASAIVAAPIPTVGGGNLILAGPITGNTGSSETWTGGTSGATFAPTSIPIAIGPAEVWEPALLAPTTSTTGCGFVNNAVWFQDGAYAQGALNVLVIASRALGTTMASPGGANYTDFATSDVLSGQPLPQALMQELNENAKFSILRPEVTEEFTVGPGTTVPSFTSPWDSYAYETSEEMFIEWWFNTGAAPGDLRDFSIQVNPQSGLMQTRTDYYRGAGWNVPFSFGLITFGSGSSIATAQYGYPGSPVYSNMPSGGPWGVPGINVVIIASRQSETELQNVNLVATPGNTSPAPPGSGNLLANPGFEFWSSPQTTAIAVAGVADDWYTDQEEGTWTFLQETGLISGSNFAQGIGAAYTASTISGRSTNPANRASIRSMSIPIDPTGCYSFAFIAQASPVVINYGFYCRVHFMDLNLANDTAAELLWPSQAPATIPGVITSGTFLVGELIIQTTSLAATFCAANTAPLEVFGGVVGTPDSSDTWVGQVSGAIFTPSAVPSQAVTSDESQGPGTTIGANYGSPLNTSIQVFGNPPYVFQVPLNGASSLATNFGASVLNQAGTPTTLNFTPAYIYIEFDLWSPLNNGGGPGGSGLMFAIVDNCVLLNVTGVESTAASGGGIVVGGTPPTWIQRGRPLSPILVNTGGGAATFPVKGVGDATNLNTVDIIPGAVSSSIQQQTNVYVNITTTGQIATVTIAPNGGYVKLRCYTMLEATNSSALGYSLSLYKGDDTGTLLAQMAYGQFPAENQFQAVALEGIDTTPGTSSQQYTAYLTTNTAGTVTLIPVILIAENAKV